MANIKTVVFDLDGTLVKSAESIYFSMIHAFDQLNIKHNVSIEKFNTMIGWHFEDIFNEVNIVVPNFEEFLFIYKDVYFDYIDKSALYDNVESTLSTLKKKGLLVALLTTKGQDQAEKIITHLNFDKYFDYIMGRRLGIAHKPSPEPLETILRELECDPQSALMVGDSEMDIQCGNSANSSTCGVTYGYRSKELLIEEKPTFLIDNLSELINIVEK